MFRHSIMFDSLGHHGLYSPSGTSSSSVHGIFQARLLEVIRVEAWWSDMTGVLIRRRGYRDLFLSMHTQRKGHVRTQWECSCLQARKRDLIRNQPWDFTSSAVAKILHAQCRGPGFDLWSGDQIPHAAAKDFMLHTKIHGPKLRLLLSFSHSVVSNSLWPHGLQPTRLPCPSLSPRACSNSCPLSWWCHPTTSSPSPPACNLSQNQGLFKWVSSSHQVA